MIAEAWDATFALFDGVPTEADILRLSQNVPKQEAGRVSERELSLSRANRSVRLWAHVVDALAAGRQPDTDQIGKVGYLMRTTAVYGSGKFGAADRELIADRPEMQVPFQAEMLSVYLTRTSCAILSSTWRAPRGARRRRRWIPPLPASWVSVIPPGWAWRPIIVNHPVLFNNWILAREEAIARVRSVETASAAEVAPSANSCCAVGNRSRPGVRNIRSRSRSSPIYRPT